MPSSLPSLGHRHVEVFRAVMIAGSVTGAAAALFTSQPTVSRELARMERLLGLQLFERVRGRLQPTAPAFALYEEVQRSYAGLERIADTALLLRAGLPVCGSITSRGACSVATPNPKAQIFCPRKQARISAPKSCWIGTD